MKKIRFIALLAIIFSIAACTSLPKTPAFDLGDNAKLGYQVAIDEEIHHTHYGTTIFNNFEREYADKNWQLTNFANAEAERILSEYGFTPVKIETSENQPPSNASNTGYQQLQERYGIDGIIRLQSARSIVAVECGAYGCADFYASHPGFYSRGVAFIKPFLHVTLPGIHEAVAFKPSYIPVSRSNAYSSTNPQLKHLREFKPANFKNMSDAEWQEVEKQLKQLVTDSITSSVQALKAGSDGNGGTIRKVK